MRLELPGDEERRMRRRAWLWVATWVICVLGASWATTLIAQALDPYEEIGR